MVSLRVRIQLFTQTRIWTRAAKPMRIHADPDPGKTLFLGLSYDLGLGVLHLKYVHFSQKFKLLLLVVFVQGSDLQDDRIWNFLQRMDAELHQNNSLGMHNTLPETPRRAPNRKT
jgi:hypothetical protein